MAIIGATFREGPDRNRAVSIYSLFGAAGFSLGLVLSGLFTQVDWRWVFLFPAPVAVVLFAFGLRLIPRDPPGEHARRHYDVAGAASFAAAMVLLVYVIVTVPEAGWGSARVLGAFVLSTALLAAFALVERSAAWPLVGLRTFARPALIRSSLGAAALNGSFWDFLFIGAFQL